MKVNKKRENNNTVYGLTIIVVIFFIALVLGFPLIYNLKNTSSLIDIDKIDSDKEIDKGIVERITIENDKYFMINLLISGKIQLHYYQDDNNINNYIDNIDNAIDIIIFHIPAPDEEQLIYILDDKGDVYFYRIGNMLEKKYNVIKVDNVSNVMKLFILEDYPTNNTGGIWTLYAITRNNELIELNSESV